MDIFAFRVNLKDRETNDTPTEYGVIISASYPKATNSLVVKYRDEYDIDNIYVDSLCSGNIKTLDKSTYDKLVEIFSTMPDLDDTGEDINA